MKNLCAALFIYFLGLQDSQALFSCPQFRTEEREYSLSLFNPQQDVVDGSPYPSHQRTLFRGIYQSNMQFDLGKILEGIFFPKDWHIGSPLFMGITQVLLGKRNLADPFIPSGGLPETLETYFKARNILGDVKTLVDCDSRKKMSFDDAEIHSAKILNRMFFSQSTQNISDFYLNMSWEKYYDRTWTNLGFGNNSIEFVPSSTDDQIASIYGNKTLVFKDFRQRAVDLTFFNYKKNGYFVQSWVDYGEILSPGYLRADELIGYQERQIDRIRGSEWYTTSPNNPIVYAVYKFEVNGKKVGLVFDGLNRLCMIHDTHGMYFFCRGRKDSIKNGNIEFPEAGNEQAPFVGLIEDRALTQGDYAEILKVHGKNEAGKIPELFQKSFLEALKKSEKLKKLRFMNLEELKTQAKSNPNQIEAKE